jgi:hypothetical protein
MIPVSNVDIATFTFQAAMVDKVNEIANAVSTMVLTANSTVGITNGNAFVNGSFGSGNVYVSSQLRGGNSSSNSALVISDDGFMLDASFSTAGTFTTSTNTANQTVDSYPMASYRGAEYLLQVSSVTNSYSLSKSLVTHDGTNPFMTEYGVVVSNGTIGSFSVTANATHVSLLYSPINATNTIRFRRTAMEA